MTELINIPLARVNFPALHKKPVINGEEGKYGAKFIIEPDAEVLTTLRTQIDGMVAASLKVKKLPADKIALRDGDGMARDEYEGNFVLSASAKNKPRVVDQTGQGFITEIEECQIYSGCYVAAQVKLWAQDNKFGKRINCELVSIQFRKHGEPLAGGSVSTDDVFSAYGAVETDAIPY